jgi:hypothetical protein
VRQLIRRHQRRELGIRRFRPGGEPGEQVMDGGFLPVQVQARPVIGEQLGGQAPVLCGLAAGTGRRDRGPAAIGIRPELLLMPLITQGAPGAPPRRARLRTPRAPGWSRTPRR